LAPAAPRRGQQQPRRDQNADRAGRRRQRRQRGWEHDVGTGARTQAPRVRRFSTSAWSVAAALSLSYFFSIVTDSIVIGLTGRSPGLDVVVPPILFTTSTTVTTLQT